jgi:hypothetical protein
VKAALIALVLTVAAPSHVTVAVLGRVVSLPAAGLILAAEATATAAVAWLAIRGLRRFRSAPWPRAVLLAGSMP